ALAKLYSTSSVAVDDGCHDARRLVPAFGTLKRKGAAHIPQRPHRRTAFVCGSEIARAPWSKIEALCDELEAELEPILARSSPASLRRDSVHRVESPFTRANGLPIRDVAEWLGLILDGRVVCPGCRNTDGVALLDRGLKCHHRSCADRGKPDRPG